MNNRGEQQMLGLILVVFVVIVVGVSLFTASAQNVGDTVNTVDVANESISSLNGTTLAALTQLSGKSVTNVVVYNSTDDMILTSGNYTIYQNQVVNGVETALFNATAEGTVWSGAGAAGNWNVSYTYEPTTYISDGGGRAVANLVVIFFALAISIVVLLPTARNKALDFIRFK